MIVNRIVPAGYRPRCDAVPRGGAFLGSEHRVGAVIHSIRFVFRCSCYRSFPCAYSRI